MNFYIGYNLSFFGAPCGYWNDLNDRNPLIIYIVSHNYARSCLPGFRAQSWIEIDLNDHTSFQYGHFGHALSAVSVKSFKSLSFE